MKNHKKFPKISENLQATYKILEDMIYIHAKSRKKLTINNLKDNDFNKI